MNRIISVGWSFVWIWGEEDGGGYIKPWWIMGSGFDKGGFGGGGNTFG